MQYRNKKEKFVNIKMQKISSEMISTHFVMSVTLLKTKLVNIFQSNLSAKPA